MSGRARMLLAGALAASCLAAAAPAGDPWTPASGADIVERLPAADAGLDAMRAALRARPGDATLAASVAQRYLDRALADAEPRYLGYAEQALAPWWRERQAPNEILMLRARLRQQEQRYSDALADLDRLLRSEPRHVQGWLTRYAIELVTGDHTAARASCGRLQPLVAPAIVQACLADVDSVTGGGKRAYAALASTLQRQPGLDPGVRLWMATLLAEISVRQDQPIAAQMYFATALALGPADPYLLGAYSDFLLDRQRAPEVLNLLRDRARTGPLLLLRALALRATGAPEVKAAVEALRAHFDADGRRGDGRHLRERARFALHLAGDPQAAARLVRENWAVRKEPADLRILLEAAAAANDRLAARQGLAWLERTGFEDATLDATVDRLGGLR